MIKRKLNNEKCGCCCTLKEKLQYLWEHTMGAIRKVNDITPDGDGKFTVEAGNNVLLTPISNGLKIDTTGGISYYSAGDNYVDVDNNDLEISLKNPGQTGGVALHDDLEVVAQSVTNLLNGGNVGNDTRPIKIVNGVAVAIPDVLVKTPANESQRITGRLYNASGRFIGSVRDTARADFTFDAYNPTSGYITRLTISQTDTGVCKLYLEKWEADLDANGNPFASVYVGGTEIGSFQ